MAKFKVQCSQEMYIVEEFEIEVPDDVFENICGSGWRDIFESGDRQFAYEDMLEIVENEAIIEFIDRPIPTCGAEYSTARANSVALLKED